MDILVKRDRAVLDYFVSCYGKETVKKEISAIRKDILKEDYDTYKNKK